MDVIKWQTFAANNIYSVCVCVRASAISVFPPQGLSVNSSVYEDISDIMNCGAASADIYPLCDCGVC